MIVVIVARYQRRRVAKRQHGVAKLVHQAVVMLNKKLLVLVLSCVLFSESNGQVLIYVAPDGVDTANGTQEHPLATLSGARDRIRDLRKAGRSPRAKCRVLVKAGTYALSDSLRLTEEDAAPNDFRWCTEITAAQ